MIVDPKARFNRTGQVIGWERGRPARNEREARNNLKPSGTPALPAHHLIGLNIQLLRRINLVKHQVDNYTCYRNV